MLFSVIIGVVHKLRRLFGLVLILDHNNNNKAVAMKGLMLGLLNLHFEF